MKRIAAANDDFAERVMSEVTDTQYDTEADILYVTFGSAHNAFSVATKNTDEEVYLRVQQDTHRIVGIDILCFRQVFLGRHPDAKEVFDPLFNFLGDSDWRLQVKLPTGEVTLLQPAGTAPVRYLGRYVPEAARELVMA